MSLVNEMLRNLDTRRVQAGPEQIRMLDGLSVTQRRGVRGDRITRSAACIAAALLTGLCALSLWDRLQPGSDIADDAGPPTAPLAQLDSIERILLESGERAALQQGGGLPDVSTAAALASAQPVPAIGPVELLELRIEPTESGTRLVFELTRETGIALEHAPDGKDLSVTLAETRTSAALPSLDLTDTPIQSIHLNRSGEDLRVELGFATRTRTQSALLAGQDSERLVLDLQPDAEKSLAAAASEAKSAAITRHVRPPTMDQIADQTYRAAMELESGGETESAVAALRDALDFDPLHLAARETLIALLIRAGRDAEAELVLQRGRELAPAHRGFAKAQARLLMARGEPAGALHVLEQAAPSAQQDPEYRALAAALYQRQGKHAAAIEEYRELLRYDSRHAVWWMGLAISFEGQGRSEKALVAYRTAAAVGGLGEDSRHYVAARIHSLEQPGD